MNTFTTTFLFAGLCHAGSALAEPCVSATFDIPLPGAEDVVTIQVDVPSPQFPGLWQEGTINGYFYALYANGEGIVRPSRDATGWQIAIECTKTSEDCLISETGAPTTVAIKTATLLAACLKGLETQVPEVPDTIESETIAPPCGKDAVPNGESGFILQRLLVIAGADPGPVDGYRGELTQTALSAILGEDAHAMDDTNAIAALDDFLCKQ